MIKNSVRVPASPPRNEPGENASRVHVMSASGAFGDVLNGRTAGHHTRMRATCCVPLCFALSGQAAVRLWVLGHQSLFSNFCCVFMLHCQPRTDKLAVDPVHQPRNVETPSNFLVLVKVPAFLFRFLKIFSASFTMVIERPASRTEHKVALFTREETLVMARRSPSHDQPAYQHPGR